MELGDTDGNKFFLEKNGRYGVLYPQLEHIWKVDYCHQQLNGKRFLQMNIQLNNNLTEILSNSLIYDILVINSLIKNLLEFKI